MSSDSVSFPTCFPTVDEAMRSRAFDGWFSFVLQQDSEEGTLWCAKSYNPAEWVFAVLLAIMSVISVTTCVGVSFIFLRRRVKRCFRGSHEADARRLEQLPSITAIIPCYLPNEQDIIEETIDWIMNHVDWAGNLSVFLVYNTPKDLPEIEARLQEMQTSSVWPEGRSLRVMRVQESKSKAANLNAALKAIFDPYVVIYDADHHPDPESLLLLWEKMSRRQVDCVQGSYYMRNLNHNQLGCSPFSFPCLARIIDAEFFVDWTLMKPVTRTLFLGNGYFSGSNALWKTEVLASRQFSVTAQTEDVDMAIQQLLDGRRIEFCSESRSGELAPMSCASMWKQRLRWTIGWDETSLKHAGSFTESGDLNCRARAGLVWTFLIRWIMAIITVGAVYAGLPMTIVWPLDDMDWGKLITLLGRICFFSGCGPWLLATIEAAARIPQLGCQGAVQMCFVFVVASPIGFATFFFYNFVLQMVSCFKLSAGRVNGWEVTQRAPASKASLAPAHGARTLSKLEEGQVSNADRC